MSNHISIDGQKLKDFIKFGYNNLKLNAKIVNELNVFPIPDGDTADNMCMTLNGGYQAIQNLSTSSVSEIATKCAQGMLMNARGNSGVILSQLFYGFSLGTQNLETLEFDDLLNAFKIGVKQGYTAVDKPTEGTILTVAREITEHIESLNKNITTEEFISSLLDATNKSVQETPEKLQVLKDNGVVDSGGAGLYYIIEGIYKYLHGQNIEIDGEQHIQASEIDFSKFNENSVLEYGYCSEVLVQLQSSKIDIDSFDIEKLKEYLNTIGDSIVAVQTGTVVKVHVHTFAPYKLLQHCQQFGEFLKVKIENMTLQHNEATIQNKFEPKKVTNRERKKYGVVAVASGEGIVQTFYEMGADAVIDGGQTNNPSTQSFIDAFDEVNADTIFVFPNNKNIILTANQASKMYKSSQIVVVESKNIGDCYAGLSMIDFGIDNTQEILDGIYGQMQQTLTSMITTATRTTTYNELAIQENDFIGLIGKDIVVSNPTKTRAIFELIDKMNMDEKSCAVLVWGKNLSQSERQLTSDYICQKYQNIETYEIDGKQDIFDIYIILM